jgi:glycosyltransferase involved in cell wall biosynthesis
MRKIAVVHDWLSGYFGSERALEQILRLYPQADLFCVADFLPPDKRAFLDGRTITTSFIQRLPFARRHFRSYLALMPLAVEQFELSTYDLVISSSHAVAKGVLTKPGQLHISYVYTPMRYAWGLQEQYLADGRSKGIKRLLASSLLHYMRVWDLRTANGVDTFVAISNFIAQRIWKIYRRRASVIYPPVDLTSFTIGRERQPFYLTVSRLVPYKRVDVIVEAFSRSPDRQLVVIGDGPDMSRLKTRITSNITLLGYQPFELVRDYMQRTRAFIFAAEEDFGIVPLEAQACGTPVVAYAGGGAAETIIEGETGTFFPEQTDDALIEALIRFERFSGKFDPDQIRRNAERFSIERFRSEFAALVEREYAASIRQGRHAIVENAPSGSTNGVDVHYAANHL